MTSFLACWREGIVLRTRKLLSSPVVPQSLVFIPDNLRLLRTDAIPVTQSASNIRNTRTGLWAARIKRVIKHCITLVTEPGPN
uniref:Uncharacterized protein n=1 Tax=Schistosoma curassoni TaxID=6186 RepID=A0A183KNP7_9TREM